MNAYCQDNPKQDAKRTILNTPELIMFLLREIVEMAVSSDD
jgi:hypothetical protein